MHLSFFVVLPSKSYGYSIKVKGKLEMGNNIVELVKNLCESLGLETFDTKHKLTEIDDKPNSNANGALSFGRLDFSDHPTSLNIFDNIRKGENKEKTLLDEIVNSNTKEKIHVYGIHESKLKSKLNNIKV